MEANITTVHLTFGSRIRVEIFYRYLGWDFIYTKMKHCGTHYYRAKKNNINKNIPK